MNIPVQSLQSASYSAIPQQSARESKSPNNPTADKGSHIVVDATDPLQQSDKLGDRDAQERYSGPMANSSGQDSNKKDSESPEPSTDPNSIWNLSVCDDQPPTGLDIRG